MKTAIPNSIKRYSGSQTQSQPALHPPKPQQRRRKFNKRQGPRPLKQTSAGGIIFRRKGGRAEILFLRREDGRWTFPKGKQQLGESYVVAAIREIKEETGVSGLKFLASLGNTGFRYTERHAGPVKQISKTVHFFLFEAPPDAEFKLAGSEGVVDGAWIRTDRAFATLSYRNMDRILAKALRLIHTIK